MEKKKRWKWFDKNGIVRNKFFYLLKEKKKERERGKEKNHENISKVVTLCGPPSAHRYTALHNLFNFRLPLLLNWLGPLQPYFVKILIFFALLYSLFSSSGRGNSWIIDSPLLSEGMLQRAATSQCNHHRATFTSGKDKNSGNSSLGVSNPGLRELRAAIPRISLYPYLHTEPKSCLFKKNNLLSSRFSTRNIENISSWQILSLSLSLENKIRRNWRSEIRTLSLSRVQ